MQPAFVPEFVPEFVVIGHATRDLLPGGGWRLGGTVTFAALTAQRLGLRVGVVTSGPPDVLAALAAALPGVALATIPSAEATTFENIYSGGARRQLLRGRAAPLTLATLPQGWQRAALVLLAPLAREVEPALAGAFPGALVAVTPQGWLREWGPDGAVWSGALDPAASAALGHLRALILSQEDLLPPPGSVGMPGRTSEEATRQVAAWAQQVPLVVVTRGAQGADLWQQGAPPERLSGYPARETDPTGAGDVFAAAFLCALHESGDPRAAVTFANRVAARSVEREGVAGIPTRAELAAALPRAATPLRDDGTGERGE